MEDFILAPAHPERQRALPDDPGTCRHYGACAWRRNGTYARDLVVLGRLCVQRWPYKAYLGSASSLPPDVTFRQQPQTFRALVTDLYGHCVSFRDLSHLGQGGRDLAVHRGRQAPDGGGPGPQGRTAGPAPEWSRLRQFTFLAARKIQGATTDDDPVYARLWRQRIWTGNSAPCTCSAP